VSGATVASELEAERLVGRQLYELVTLDDPDLIQLVVQVFMSDLEVDGSYELPAVLEHARLARLRYKGRCATRVHRLLVDDPDKEHRNRLIWALELVEDVTEPATLLRQTLRSEAGPTPPEHQEGMNVLLAPAAVSGFDGD
jgi:hypothetical protein